MKILIADDDSLLRHMLATFLRRWGYDVVVTEDGNAAWDVLQQRGAPPLAILDWMMPGRDGVDICRRLRERKEGPYTYVILLTSRDTKSDVVAGMESGADDYLIKPFDPHELQVRLRAGRRIVDLQSALLSSISEHKRAEEALVEERNLLRTVMDNLPDRIYVKDTHGRYIIDNVAHMRYLGAAAPEEIIGKTLQDFLPQDQADLLSVEDLRVCETHQPIFEREDEVLDRTGATRWVSMTKMPIWDYHGKIVGMVGLTRDITDRKRSEQERLEYIREHAARSAAEAAQRRFAFLAVANTLLASGPDYHTTLQSVARLTVPQQADLCVIDIIEEDGTIHRVAAVHANPQFSTHAKGLLKFPPRRGSKDGASLVISSGKAQFVPLVTDDMLESIACDEEHLALLREIKPVSYISVPLKARGTLIGTVSFASVSEERRFDATDLAVTEDLARRIALAVDNVRLYRDLQKELADRERTEVALKLRTASLERINQEMDHFTKTIAQHMHQPTGAIYDGATKLSASCADVLTPEDRALLGSLCERARAVHELVEGIGVYARAGHSQVAPTLVSVEEIVRETVREIGDAAQERLHIEGKLPSLYTDRAALQQVFHHIFTSPQIGLSSEDARLDVSCREVRGYYAFNVRGGPPTAETADAAGGASLHGEHAFKSELSLAVARKITEMKGGSLAVESGPGSAPTIVFSWPIEMRPPLHKTTS